MMESGDRTCIVCGSTSHEVAFREFDVDVLRCRACGHVFSSWDSNQDYTGYFTQESVASDDQFYWNEAHDRMYADFARRYLANGSGRLLDVGCGLGYFVKHVQALDGWEAVGYEISPTAVEFARSSLGLTTIHCGRVEDSGFAPRSFDVITLWDVIEHIPEPDPLLTYLCDLLSDDGVLVMHTPNASIQLPKARLKRLVFGMRPDVHYLEARDHINLYTMSTLSRVMRRCGFEDIEFIHLAPIQSVSGSRSRVSRAVKNLWCAFATLLYAASRQSINLDNLFVAARKTSQSRRSA